MSWPEIPRTVLCSAAPVATAAAALGFPHTDDAWIRIASTPPETGWIGVWVGLGTDGDLRLDWPCAEPVLRVTLEAAWRLATERQQKHAYQAVLRASDRWLELTDSQARFLDVSEGFEVLSGHGRDQVRGRTAGEVLRGGIHQPAHYRAMDEALKRGGRWEGDVLGRRSDGSLAALESRLTAIRRGSQTLGHIASKQLAPSGASDSLIDWITRCSGHPWFLVRLPDGAVLESNHAAAELVGRRRADLVGSDLEALGIPLAQVDGGDHTSGEHPFGERVYAVQSHGRRLGEVQMALVVLQDVTTLVARARALNELADQLAEARDQALAANQAKSAFLAAMSHELRTPLNAVIGYTELVLESVDPSHVDDLNHVHRAGRQLLTLVDEVLDLARVEAGETEVAEETVDLREVLDEVAATLALRAQERDIALEVAGCARVTTDPHRVRQILLNFAGNAVKYAVPGKVRLGVEANEVFVQDEGPGLTPDQQRAVFEPFHQGNEHADGVGLGLAISRRAADLIGATVSVSSEAGSGSRFSLWLP